MKITQLLLSVQAGAKDIIIAVSFLSFGIHGLVVKKYGGWSSGSIFSEVKDTTKIATFFILVAIVYWLKIALSFWKFNYYQQRLIRNFLLSFLGVLLVFFIRNFIFYLSNWIYGIVLAIFSIGAIVFIEKFNIDAEKHE